MTICDLHGRWQRSPGCLRWYSDDLTGWCVTGTFTLNRRGVYRRSYLALYRGATVGEVYPASTPEQVMEELDDLLGRGYRSLIYINA